MTIFCNSTTNTMKEQVRTRKCLYGDGSETKNTHFCSNESAIIPEQKCFERPTSDVNENSRFVYIAAGVVCLVFAVIGVAMLNFGIRCHKKIKTNHIQVNDDVYAVVTKKEIKNVLYQNTTPYGKKNNDVASSHEAMFGVKDDSTYETFNTA